jgi:hypothetical protein
MKNETLQKLIAGGYDFNAIVKVNYDGMQNKKFPVFEIVGTRITIKKDNRQIDFNINEVTLQPISYNEKEYKQIQAIKTGKY